MNDNIYVFTTRRIVLGQDPILRVLHDEDGDWQFLSREEVLTESDAMVVSLGGMMEIDSSLKDVVDIPTGMQAVRDRVGNEWRFLRASR